ncbi:MAG: hypothetical protein ACPGOV_08055 [Magnetovibrionaceae bacterium]
MNDIKQQTRLSGESISTGPAKAEGASSLSRPLDRPLERPLGPADIYLDAIARAAKARRALQKAGA